MYDPLCLRPQLIHCRFSWHNMNRTSISIKGGFFSLYIFTQSLLIYSKLFTHMGVFNFTLKHWIYVVAPLLLNSNFLCHIKLSLYSSPYTIGMLVCLWFGPHGLQKWLRGIRKRDPTVSLSMFFFHFIYWLVETCE